ncbi:MAG: DNA N-6-adenine-methyltransferase [Cellulomonas sp.]
MPATPAARPAHLSSASDDWPTPADFYAALDAEFGFVVDVCASSTNHKTSVYFGLDHVEADRRDGLAGDWAADASALGGAVWMNPPYGRPIAHWMAKAVAAARAGAVVVTLVPVRADTKWWHEHVLATGAEVRYVRGRLTFGAATNTAAFASAVVIFRPSDVLGGPGPVGIISNHPVAQMVPGLPEVGAAAGSDAPQAPSEEISLVTGLAVLAEESAAESVTLVTALADSGVLASDATTTGRLHGVGNRESAVPLARKCDASLWNPSQTGHRLMLIVRCQGVRGEVPASRNKRLADALELEHDASPLARKRQRARSFTDPGTAAPATTPRSDVARVGRAERCTRELRQPRGVATACVPGAWVR